MLKKPMLLAAFAFLAGAAIFFAAQERKARPARRGFVSTSGTRFVIDGQPFRFVGANVAVMYRDEDRARMPETLREAARDGVRVLRVWAFGGLGWLIAAVLGFSRARAFGPAIRWFALSAVCLVIFHLHFLLLGILAAFGARNDNDFGSVLSVGAFFNLFVVLGAICSIMGFVKLTEQR